MMSQGVRLEPCVGVERVTVCCSSVQDKLMWSLGHSADVMHVIRFWDVLAFHDTAFVLCTKGNAEMQELMRDSIGGTWDVRSFHTKVIKIKVDEQDLADGVEELYRDLYRFIVHDVTYCCYLPDAFFIVVTSLLTNFHAKCQDPSYKVNFNTVSFAVHILLALALPILDRISVLSFCPSLQAIIPGLAKSVDYPGIFVPMLMLTCRLLDHPEAQDTALDANLIPVILSLMSSTKSLYRLTLMARILYKASRNKKFTSHVPTIANHFNKLVHLASNLATPLICDCLQQRPELHVHHKELPALLQESLLRGLVPVIDYVYNVDIVLVMCCWTLRKGVPEVRDAALQMCKLLTVKAPMGKSKLCNRALENRDWQVVLVPGDVGVAELQVIHALAVRAQSHKTSSDAAITPALVTDFINGLRPNAISYGSWGFKTAVELLSCLSNPVVTYGTIAPLVPAFREAISTEGQDVLEPAIRLLRWLVQGAPKALEVGLFLVEVLGGIDSTDPVQSYLYDLPVNDARVVVKAGIDTNLVWPLAFRLLQGYGVARVKVKDDMVSILRDIASQGYSDTIKQLNPASYGLPPTYLDDARLPEPHLNWSD
eukprot:TRINITY_DN14115_c0_g1_i1.p1 TRINITY_DN14115_c0_g1~~TRINITY_DN14115_c0_g1_i1.p1  ORF type:complete len:597 (+),score=149.42 TRINITY_DN14115_c0_g1_i1:170-1960(+)